MTGFLGIIPARGGSKGISGKNVKDLAGKPLIAHSIAAANQAKQLDFCLVSTDSDEIKSISEAHGGWVPFLRPGHLAEDHSTTVDAVLHATDWFVANQARNVDYVVLLQPTSPFRTARDIDDAIGVMLAHPGRDSLISCYDASHVHPTIMYHQEGEVLTPYSGEGCITQRQGFEPVYVRNGAIYIVKLGALQAARQIIVGDPLPYMMPRERSINIDEPHDLDIARCLASSIFGGEQA